MTRRTLHVQNFLRSPKVVEADFEIQAITDLHAPTLSNELAERGQWLKDKMPKAARRAETEEQLAAVTRVYPVLSGSSLRLWRSLLPATTSVDDFDEVVPDGAVCELIDYAEQTRFFTRLEVWHSAHPSRSKQFGPMLVGVVVLDNTEHYFPVVRWAKQSLRSPRAALFRRLAIFIAGMFGTIRRLCWELSKFTLTTKKGGMLAAVLFVAVVLLFWMSTDSSGPSTEISSRQSTVSTIVALPTLAPPPSVESTGVIPPPAYMDCVDEVSSCATKDSIPAKVRKMFGILFIIAGAMMALTTAFMFVKSVAEPNKAECTDAAFRARIRKWSSVGAVLIISGAVGIWPEMIFRNFIGRS